MITEISGLPSNMAGFRAKDTVTEEDFTGLVMPRVKQFVEENGELNYMLVLDTPIKNFTIGAWMKDAVMGIKHLTKWNRAAIVSDVDSIRTFTNIFSVFIPGEFKGFEHKRRTKGD